MRIPGRMAAEVLEMIGDYVKPGVSTEDLDTLCHDHIVKVQRPFQPAWVTKATPSRSAPRSTMSSVTASLSQKILKAGDIVNIDVTVIYEGFHGDTSKMFLSASPPSQPSAWYASRRNVCISVSTGETGRASGRYWSRHSAACRVEPLFGRSGILRSRDRAGFP